ncbi:cytochrome c oxidase subunit II [Halorarum halobium]|uniref:cytochrome c oxidase subunit II n=1 Tax=Halorarum halobium TaxID=3075121 RepID=UPI0028A9D943|nr:cytochrome c oxidase subunit II [Halobaculum sp. XH14]
MKGTRLGTLLATLGGLTLFVGTAAAQPSTTAELINQLNDRLLYIGVPITLLVEVILIYTVLNFKDADEAKPTRENRRLEITWTVATAIILLFVGVASYGVLAHEDVTYTGDEIAPNESDVHVQADAYQWNWEMNYPEENVSALTAGDVELAQADGVEGPVIVLPADRDVYISVTSQDVIHALHVPDMGLKQDAVPGQTNTIKTHTLDTGVYQGYCAEYCGVAHSQMYFSVVVVPQDDYQSFLSNQNATSANASA